MTDLCERLRDARGHFAEHRCVNAHDRCFYGPSEDCPYCEIACRKCHALLTNKGTEQ